MTTIATPPGGDPGRLPGNPFGFGPLMDWYDGNGPSGPGGNCSECEQTPWVPPGTPSSAPAEGGNAQGGNTETAGTRFTSAPSPGRGSATSAMYRAAALYGTARQVGVILPRITTSEGCTGCGPCNGWVNLEGNLSIQMGPPGTGHPFDPPVCFTDNSAAPFTPNQFGGWQNSFDPGVFDNLDGTVKLTTPNGTTVVYTGNPTGGNYYTTPEGVQSRLKLLSGGTGWEEVQFNGLKRTYDDTGRLTKYQSDAGTWTVTRDGTKVSSIEGPTGKRTTYSYDVNGKLEKITDSGGRETLFGFTGDLLTKITSPEQCVTSFTDESVTNRLETWTTPAGVNLTFSYDASNRLTKIEGPGTAVTTYSHDTSTMAITDARGNTTTFTRDSSGLLESVQNALGQRVSYTWEAKWPKTITDARGNTYTLAYQSLVFDANVKRLKAIQKPTGGIFTYLLGVLTDTDKLQTLIDERGYRSTLTWSGNRLSTLQNAEGKVTSHTYTTAHQQLETVKNPLGKVWTMAYSGGLKTEDINPLGERTTYTHDAAGWVKTVKDPLGNVTTITRDDVNRLETVTNPLAETTTYLYDSTTGLLQSVTDPLGNRTTNQYDSNGRLEARINALGYRTAFSYDKAGNVTEIKNALGKVTTQSYDALNRLQAVTDPLGNATTYGYDASGNFEKVTNPLGYVTTTQYDKDGRLEVEIDPLGNRTTFSYDAMGNQTEVKNPLAKVTTTIYDRLTRVEAIVDALGRRTTNSYDTAGRLQSVKDALGAITTTAYDTAGRVTSIQNGNGYTTTFQHNVAGELTAEIDPLNRRTTLSYDAAGRLKTKLDARAITTTYSYDKAGRLTKREYKNDPPTTLGYDAVGNLTSAANTAGIYTLSYDKLDRLEVATDPAGIKLTYSYDAAGRRDKLTTSDGVFSYSYDKASQLEYLINPQGDRTTLSYDAAGRTTRKQLANASTASFSYDAASQVATVHNLTSSGSVISRYTYTYDAVGNPTKIEEGGSNVVDWTYDAVFRLVRETRSGDNAFDTTYTYDAVGNRKTRQRDGALTTSTYDAANQLKTSVASSGTTTYSYDSAGNLQVIQTPSNARTTYSWNDENQQSRIQLASGTVVTQTYRWDGLRHKKQVGSATEKFVYDGQNYLIKTDGSNVVQAVLTNEPLEYGNLISQYIRLASDTWAPVYHHYDALGSTRQLTNISQVVANRYVYTAWGEIELADEAISNLFRWIGQLGYYFDDEDDTYYVRARHYDPLRGRWSSQDPLLHPLISAKRHAREGFVPGRLFGDELGGISLYEYASSNPSVAVDASGTYLWIPLVLLIPILAGCRKPAPAPAPAPPPAPTCILIAAYDGTRIPGKIGKPPATFTTWPRQLMRGCMATCPGCNASRATAQADCHNCCDTCFKPAKRKPKPADVNLLKVCWATCDALGVKQ